MREIKQQKENNNITQEKKTFLSVKLKYTNECPFSSAKWSSYDPYFKHGVRLNTEKDKTINLMLKLAPKHTDAIEKRIKDTYYSVNVWALSAPAILLCYAMKPETEYYWQNVNILFLEISMIITIEKMLFITFIY